MSRPRSSGGRPGRSPQIPRRHEKGEGGAGPQVGGRAPPHAGRRHDLHGQQGSPLGGCGGLGSTGGLGFERARHQAHSEGGPVAGTMDQVRPLMREQRSHDCASLDWPTGPHPTPSGSGLAPTADRSKTPAAGSRSRGIDSTGPVTEAALPDCYFDWIYIDTSHTFDLTLQELRLSARKLKATGYLAGHDFSVGNVVLPVVYGVIGACHTFCREAGRRYRWLTVEGDGAFSFCLERMPV